MYFNKLESLTLKQYKKQVQYKCFATKTCRFKVKFKHNKE